MRISTASERENRRALRRAVSGEMAMSPTYSAFALGLCAIRGKRKHIGGAVLVPERPVEPSHGGVADQLDRHRFRREAQFSPDALVEIVAEA